ncbi:MAG: DUF4347 domain-containing protein [Chlorobiaceae bacterium]|nr:DUF4347 domain-containing protein [Chlorobiaceae bacterium]
MKNEKEFAANITSMNADDFLTSAAITSLEEIAVQQGRELVIADSALEDKEVLLGHLASGTDLWSVDAGADLGVILRKAFNSGYARLHFLGHGQSGAISLGGRLLQAEDFATQSEGFLNSKVKSMHFWSCLTGAGEKGRAFVDRIGQAFGVAVTAFNGLVGAESKGGNWFPDVWSEFVVDAGNPFVNAIAYQHTLVLLEGDENDNILIGGAGNDTLIGWGGADSMTGGAGDDRYYVDNAGDVVSEVDEPGIDAVYTKISYTLTANVENLFLQRFGAIDGTGNSLNNTIVGNDSTNTVSGGGGNDTLYGGGGTDTLNGDSENDVLDGGAGNDTLNGGTGNDALLGGSGADQLFGDSGRDVFTYRSEGESGIAEGTMDVILDFTTGQDKIMLTGIDADSSTSGNQAFSNVILSGATEFTGAGQLRFDSASHILYGNTDSDIEAEFAIVVTGLANIQASDIFL